MSFDIHSVYQGRTRRLARRWPRVTLTALAIAALIWGIGRAIQAAATGT